MVTCDGCGADLEAPRECDYCGRRYCEEHRLPEHHDCDGVRGWAARGGRFESGFDG